MTDPNRRSVGRLVRLLVRLHPRPFRERYGSELLETAHALLRSRGFVGSVRVYLDLLRSAVMEHLGRRPGISAVSNRQSNVRGRGEESMRGTLIHDARSTIRRTVRTPWFSLAAIVIVAVGIGANVAVFTLVNAVLLRPPPFEDPERVVRIYQDSDDGEPSSSSYPAYLDMTTYDDVFESVAASSADQVSWEPAEGGPRPAVIEYVSSSYVDVVGRPLPLGRWFDASLDTPGAGYFAVVNHATWRNQMAADPGVVGRVVRLNGRPVTILGVGPEGFEGSAAPIVTDFWLSISSVEVGGDFRVSNLERREDHWYDVVARLSSGVTVEQAQSAMDALAARLASEFPELNQGRDITVFRAEDVRVHPEVDAAIAPAGMIVMAIAGIVLLLACSNLANLLLVQGISRSGEVAIRRALGASPARVARLFLGEAVLLAGIGGAIGVGLSRWMLGVVTRLRLLPVSGDLSLSIDGRVLAFTVLLVLASASFFGVAPALRALRSDPARSLGGEARSRASGRGASALQGGLVAVQVAASVVLLVGATLLVRSLANLSRLDPGFDPAPLAYVQTNTNVPGLGDGSARLLEELRVAVESAPGVEGAAITTRLPVGFGGSTTTVVEGYEPTTGTGSVELDYAVVTDEYFDVMGLPIVAGRGFQPDDRFVVIVNETAAQRYWGGDAVDGRIRPQAIPDAWRRVVGVVTDHTVRSLGEPGTPILYYPLGRGGINSGYIVARGSMGADELLPVLRSELQRVEPSLPIDALATMQTRLGDALRTPRLTAMVLGAFALLALLLASVGIYSVVAFSVARRTAELGIRVALGARREQLVLSAVGRMLAVVALGLVVGVLLAAAAVRVLGSLLFGLGALDPTSFAIAALVLTAISAVAAWLPARRAAGADPVEALRRG